MSSRGAVEAKSEGENVMKVSLLVPALSVALLSASSAFAQQPCNVEIDQRAIMLGGNFVAAFDVNSGQGCMYSIVADRTVSGSEVSQAAQHGTVRLTQPYTFNYEPTAGYRGSDGFAVTVKGQTLDGKPGASVVRFNVNVK
jgi:hypothetical protein